MAYKEITITTQKELDAIKGDFKEFTYIYIRSTEKIYVTKKWGNSSVEAWENSSVEAWGNSSVVARENSSVEARENSSVEAWGNSSVVARGNSSVEARGNSSVEAWENSSVEAWENSSVVARENSSVEAWGNSSVEARENSSVEAWGNSSVVARENSSVEAWENSSVVARGNSSVEARGNSSVVALGNSSVVARENSSVEARGNSSVSGFEFSFILVLSTTVVLKKLYQYVIVRLRSKVSIPKKPKTVTIIDHSKIELKHDKKTFVEYYELDAKKVILYKSVDPKTLCDFRTGTIKYEGIVECPDFDSSNKRECGGGLHLCAKPSQALSFNQGQLLKCEVDLKDIVVYSKSIEKVRCKKVKVLGKCDIKGELL